MAVIPIFGVTYAEKIALTVSNYTQGQWLYQTDEGPSGHPQGYYQLVNSAWVSNTAYANNNFITNRLTIRSPFPGDGPYIGLINEAEAGGGQWYIGSAGSSNSPGLGAFEIFDFLLGMSRFVITALGRIILNTSELVIQTLSGLGGRISFFRPLTEELTIWVRAEVVMRPAQAILKFAITAPQNLDY